MQIIIPMSGRGNRFVKAGYATPKCLLTVDGKPVIERVVNMFPGENDFLFICNKEHLQNTEMESILKHIKPDGKIRMIESHKLGPVFAVSKIMDELDDNEPVMISYCDYGQDWDFSQFKKDADRLDFSGAVPCYTGFHPHLLHKNLYAGVLADENGMMRDIQEKHCFTENPENSYHSGGAYYFKSGALMKKYFRELLDLKMSLNGEYYVSMVYYLLKRDGLPVFIPTVKYFMQWGTPEDLEEYEAWSRLIHREFAKEKQFTKIPAEREKLIKIPYEKGSEEFEKSYRYWKNYFTKTWST
jgi:NDP-sugar pyrophosphorylase family protein